MHKIYDSDIRVGADGHPLHLYPLTTKPKKEEA